MTCPDAPTGSGPSPGNHLTSIAEALARLQVLPPEALAPVGEWLATADSELWAAVDLTRGGPAMHTPEGNR